MSSSFTDATREQLRLRMAIDGPPGAGKSYTSLRFGMALAIAEAKLAGRSDLRIAAIDTEHGSLRKYVGESPDGVPFAFKVREIKTFAPTEYTARIEEAGRAGFDVLIIDSLSHAWTGKEGALQTVDRLNAASANSGWRTVTPMHNAMVEAILQSPCHVIATMRSRTETVMEKDERGKTVPRKVGLAPVQREGMEYEFDVYGSMDWSQVLTVTKTRCSALTGMMVVKPGPAFIEPIIQWLQQGIAVNFTPTSIMATDEQIAVMITWIQRLGKRLEDEKKDVFRRFAVSEFAELTREQASEYIRRLEIAVHEKEQKDRRFTESVFQQSLTAPSPNSAANGHTPPPGPEPELPAMPPRVNSTPEASDISLACLTHLAELRGELFLLIGIQGQPELENPKWREILARRNVTSAKQLTEAQGLELAQSLRGAIRKLRGGQAGVSEHSTAGAAVDASFRGRGNLAPAGNVPGH